jgi:transposase
MRETPFFLNQRATSAVVSQAQLTALRPVVPRRQSAGTNRGARTIAAREHGTADRGRDPDRRGAQPRQFRWTAAVLERGGHRHQHGNHPARRWRPDRTAPLRFGAKLGEPVAAFGYPLSGLLATSGNFTLGKVTSLAGHGDDSAALSRCPPRSSRAVPAGLSWITADRCGEPQCAQSNGVLRCEGS